MRINLLIASVATALLSTAACVGGLSDPSGTTGGGGGGGTGSDPTESSARELFNSTVMPLLSNCQGCHVGPETTATNMFLGPTLGNEDSYYDHLTADEAVNGDFSPTAASILTKGAHEGPAWSSSDSQTISAWLSAEAQERGVNSQPTNPTDPTDPNPDPSQPNLTARGAEMQWAACMSISGSDYTSTKAYAIADMQSGNGACYSCHEPGGAGGAYWGVDNAYMTMLAKWQQEVFITAPFEATVMSGSAGVYYQMEVAQEKICDKGQEQKNNEGTHPVFNCQQNVDGVQPLTALANFATAVQAKITANSCPTPAFAPPDGGSGTGSGT